MALTSNVRQILVIPPVVTSRRWCASPKIMRARTTKYAALAAIATAGRTARPNQNYELRLPAACARRVVGPATRPCVSIATAIPPRARECVIVWSAAAASSSCPTVVAVVVGVSVVIKPLSTVQP